MPIAELFLGALITVLFERLASREVLNFARREGIESQLKKWSKMLVKIQAVLADAEHKLIHGTGEHNQLNLWLKDLRDLAFDVDDLLDEVAYDALAKISTSPARGESSKVHRLCKCFRACNPCMAVSNAKKESKIKVITERFQEIVTQQDLLRLSDTTSVSVGRVGNTDEWGTSCVVDESAVFGREKDKEAIVQLLLQGRDEVGVGVLSIIGMGGLGKTTLAQLVYNDKTVEDYFPVKAWTCVSDQFDIVRITRSILESLKLTPSGTDLNSLHVQLKDALSNKKFLIILDDVWNENCRAWDSLKAPFSSGLSGSMVIVTTRNEGVASLVGNFSPYRLKQLSDDICLSIFLRHALGATSFEAHEYLSDIGFEIATRCKGLPLTAKMLGGILRNKERPKQWRDILQSEIWDLPESGILPALKLSYHHLPSHLKQCFAYCSLFPTDYEFRKQDLILLWMAEGFLQPQSNQKKQMQELGSDYFDNLTSRSFFQPSSTSSSTFVMHDLIHDLARHVASDAYLFVSDHNATSQATIKVRHSSFVRKGVDNFKRLEAFGDMNSLRTFLALPIEKRPSIARFSRREISFLSSKVLLDLLLNLTRMRVLSLCGYEIKELPDSMGHLKHLRYLNMTGTCIEKLPESVTSLFNLLTLILRFCLNLKELPPSIGNLVNLQYFDLHGTPELLQMPSGMKHLTGLQKLSKFVVGKNEELGISDLKNFSSLRGKLLITGLHNVVDILGAIHADLNGKDGLEKLRMIWREEFDDSRDQETEEQVLHHLQPPKSLLELQISYYGGKRLPFWIGDPLCAPNMVQLRIDGCKNVTSLPPLGRLPLLKVLTLCQLDGVTSVGDELYGYDDPLFVGKAFPSLEKLIFIKLLGWVEWSCSSGGISLPSTLQLLQLDGCKALKTLPRMHTGCFLDTLFIRDCYSLEHFPVVKEAKNDELVCWRVKTLSISDNKKLSEDITVHDVETLCISWCPTLMCFPGRGKKLPSSLRSLSVSNCENLQTLTEGMLMQDDDLPLPLEEISLYDCPSITSFPTGGELPSSLKKLTLEYCYKLAAIPVAKPGSPLEEIYINCCPDLQELPESLVVTVDNFDF